MPRPKKQEIRVCDQHVFMLKPKLPICYYQQPVTVKYCAEGVRVGKNNASRTQSCYEGPVFNRDKNFSMPSFVLNSEKNKFLENAAKGKVQNENKYCNYNDEKTEMLVPKPNSKNTFCNVCKEKYEDYQDHILQSKHKKKIRSNPFNNEILQIQAKYKLLAIEQLKEQLKEKEAVQTIGENSNVIVIEDEEEDDLVGLIGQPRKMVKPDQDYVPSMRQYHLLKYHNHIWYYGGYMSPGFILPPPGYCGGSMPFINFSNMHFINPGVGYLPEHRNHPVLNTLRPQHKAPIKSNYIVVDDKI